MIQGASAMQRMLYESRSTSTDLEGIEPIVELQAQLSTSQSDAVKLRNRVYTLQMEVQECSIREHVLKGKLRTRSAAAASVRKAMLQDLLALRSQLQYYVEQQQHHGHSEDNATSTSGGKASPPPMGAPYEYESYLDIGRLLEHVDGDDASLLPNDVIVVQRMLFDGECTRLRKDLDLQKQRIRSVCADRLADTEAKMRSMRVYFQEACRVQRECETRISAAEQAAQDRITEEIANAGNATSEFIRKFKDEAEATIDGLSVRVADVTMLLEAAQAENEVLTEKIERMQHTKKAVAAKQLQEMEQNLDLLYRQVLTKEEDLAVSKKEMKELKGTMEEMQSRSDVLQEELRRRSDMIEELDQRVSDLQRERDRAVRSAKEEIQRITASIEAEVAHRVAESAETLRLAEVEEELSVMRSALDDCKLELHDATQRITLMEETNRHRVVEHLEALDAMQAKLQQEQNRYLDAESKVSELEKRLTQVEASKESLKSARPALGDAIMQAQRVALGLLDGGRYSDLNAVRVALDMCDVAIPSGSTIRTLFGDTLEAAVAASARLDRRLENAEWLLVRNCDAEKDWPNRRIPDNEGDIRGAEVAELTATEASKTLSDAVDTIPLEASSKRALQTVSAVVERRGVELKTEWSRNRGERERTHAPVAAAVTAAAQTAAAQASTPRSTPTKLRSPAQLNLGALGEEIASSVGPFDVEGPSPSIAASDQPNRVVKPSAAPGRSSGGPRGSTSSASGANATTKSTRTGSVQAPSVPNKRGSLQPAVQPSLDQNALTPRERGADATAVAISRSDASVECLLLVSSVEPPPTTSNLLSEVSENPSSTTKEGRASESPQTVVLSSIACQTTQVTFALDSEDKNIDEARRGSSAGVRQDVEVTNQRAISLAEASSQTDPIGESLSSVPGALRSNAKRGSTRSEEPQLASSVTPRTQPPPPQTLITFEAFAASLHPSSSGEGDVKKDPLELWLKQVPRVRRADAVLHLLHSMSPLERNTTVELAEDQKLIKERVSHVVVQRSSTSDKADAPAMQLIGAEGDALSTNHSVHALGAMLRNIMTLLPSFCQMMMEHVVLGRDVGVWCKNSLSAVASLLVATPFGSHGEDQCDAATKAAHARAVELPGVSSPSSSVELVAAKWMSVVEWALRISLRSTQQTLADIFWQQQQRTDQQRLRPSAVVVSDTNESLLNMSRPRSALGLSVVEEQGSLPPRPGSVRVARISNRHHHASPSPATTTQQNVSSNRSGVSSAAQPESAVWGSASAKLQQYQTTLSQQSTRTTTTRAHPADVTAKYKFGRADVASSGHMLPRQFTGEFDASIRQTLDQLVLLPNEDAAVEVIPVPSAVLNTSVNGPALSGTKVTLNAVQRSSSAQLRRAGLSTSATTASRGQTIGPSWNRVDADASDSVGAEDSADWTTENVLFDEFLRRRQAKSACREVVATIRCGSAPLHRERPTSSLSAPMEQRNKEDDILPNKDDGSHIVVYRGGDDGEGEGGAHHTTTVATAAVTGVRPGKVLHVATNAMTGTRRTTMKYPTISPSSLKHSQGGVGETDDALLGELAEVAISASPQYNDGVLNDAAALSYSGKLRQAVARGASVSSSLSRIALPTNRTQRRTAPPASVFQWQRVTTEKDSTGGGSRSGSASRRLTNSTPQQQQRSDDAMYQQLGTPVQRWASSGVHEESSMLSFSTAVLNGEDNNGNGASMTSDVARNPPAFTLT